MSVIINPAEEAQKKALLSHPHSLFVTDELLNLHIGAFWSSFTFGLKSPAGNVVPVLTMKLPSPDAIKWAKAILSAAKENKAAIQEEHKNFQTAIKA